MTGLAPLGAGSHRFSLDSESEDQNTDTASVLREKHPQFQSIWDWKKVDDSYKGSKIPFNQEVIHHVHGVSEAFKLFLDDALMSQIANKTTVSYAREFINTKQDDLPPQSIVQDWHNVDSGELYVHFALQMLMGIIQKPSVKTLKIISWTLLFFTRQYLRKDSKL